MSSLLSARMLTKAFPSNLLFEEVSLRLTAGDRVGLIGPNGAGKSTFLKILAGVEHADGGEVMRTRGLNVIYVAQDDVFSEEATPRSAVCDQLIEDDARLDRDTRAEISLSKVGFTNLDRPVKTLSGGWKKRLSLACALAHEPDVLMLDEPTNHLDLEGVLWLESFVQQASMSMIFVTHDRTFLENTASRIVELSPAYPGGTFETKGNYSEFLHRKQLFLEAQAAAESSLANRVRQDTAWLRQGIQGRQTRNKTQVRDAAQRRGQLKATKDRNLAPTKTTTIDFQATERKTKKLLAMHSVKKSMGEKKLFDGLDLTLTPGQRMGLLGVNGAGKTTLLRLMSGDLEPDSGTIKRASDLKVVTFSQHRGTLIPEQTLQEALCPVGDMIEYRGSSVHVSGWAKRFLFSPDQLSTYVGNLSGGEQARVLLANLMLDPADLLLLDEPTNDLDIPSLEVLEEALMEFPGALVLVTHDRFMLERIATEYIGLDDKGTAKRFMTYQQWNQARVEAAKAKHKSNTTTPNQKPTKNTRRRKFNYNEQREFDGMEDAILKAESEVERLEAIVENPNEMSDHVKATQTYEALSSAQEHVKNLYTRWSELEKIQNAD